MDSRTFILLKYYWVIEPDDLRIMYYVHYEKYHTIQNAKLFRGFKEHSLIDLDDILKNSIKDSLEKNFKNTGISKECDQHVNVYIYKGSNTKGPKDLMLAYLSRLAFGRNSNSIIVKNDLGDKLCELKTRINFTDFEKNENRVLPLLPNDLRIPSGEYYEILKEIDFMSTEKANSIIEKELEMKYWE